MLPGVLDGNPKMTVKTFRFLLIGNNVASSPRPSRLGHATDQDSEEKEPSMSIIGCDFHSRFQQVEPVTTLWLRRMW